MLRELEEECRVTGRIIRRTCHVIYAPDDEAVTCLVEIGDQEPCLGYDPELASGEEILVNVRWMTLSEIPERDRVTLRKVKVASSRRTPKNQVVCSFSMIASAI